VKYSIVLMPVTRERETNVCRYFSDVATELSTSTVNGQNTVSALVIQVANTGSVSGRILITTFYILPRY